MDRDAIRRALEEQLADIEQRHHKVDQSRRREHTPLEGDWNEDAIVRENDDVLEALDVEGRARIVQIRGALERLEHGTYGLCVACDRPIAHARLAALPEVATCIACANTAPPPRR